jgi:hypothetical protein
MGKKDWLGGFVQKTKNGSVTKREREKRGKIREK